MTPQEYAYWERIYRTTEYVYGTEPNRYLLAQRHRLRHGMKALSLGDGEGRNGVWLAAQGLKTTSLDLSPSAVAKAKRLASLKQVSLHHECCDALQWHWPVESFDIVVSLYFHLSHDHRRMVHRKIVDALRPGGLLVLAGFHVAHAAASSGNHDAFYTAELLEADFYDLAILENLEGPVCLDEGFMHQGSAPVVRLLAQKPLVAAEVPF